MASRLQKVQALFEQAAELPSDKRREFLLDAAGGDETLVTEVEVLLRHDAEANDSLFVSLGEQASDAFADKPRRETIGRYRVVRELGQGGMGTVYLARRDDAEYEMEVAIKLVPAVIDRDELMRRFKAERQIMASLEHPNIARLLDGDTTRDGVPYVVMEYVQGVPIDQYCSDNVYRIQETSDLMISTQQIIDQLPTTDAVETVKTEVNQGTASVPSVEGLGYRAAGNSYEAFVTIDGEDVATAINVLKPSDVRDGVSDLLADQLLNALNN